MSSATVGAVRAGTWAIGLTTAPSIGAPSIAPGIVAWALEYVQPLESWFQDLLGDPAQVDGVAASWDQVERTLTGVADELQQMERQLELLEGRTARTLALRYHDLMPAARDAAEWAGAVAAAARLASRVVAGVRQFIFDFLDRLARFIGALFGFSLNPFEKVDELRQLAAASAEFMYAGRQLIDTMFGAFTDLIVLLQNLGPVIDATLVKLRETLAQMLPVFEGLGGGLFGAAQGARFGPFGLLLGTALGIAGGASMGAAHRDALTESGDVTRYSDDRRTAASEHLASDLTQERREAFLSGKLGGLSDLVQANSLTDALGGAESTAIDVKLVRGADGKEHWVVSLPSTQEWFDTFGTGAMNDRNTNLALMFEKNPEMTSQYERAVLRAMREAGMAPGDPVVYTGFSQGGIMAARLAENATLPYNTIGVVTNGSPIDSFDIPSSVQVVAFQHANDPVAMLDGNACGPTADNVRRVVLPAPGDVTDVAQAHNNNNYATSIDRYASDLSTQYSWMGGEIIDHQVFEGVQR